MKLSKRFALSTLLLLMLVVALVFGYAQWRKQRLLSRLAELRDEERVQVQVSDDWFWPELRGEAVVSFNRDKNGKLLSGQDILTNEELSARCAILDGELKGLGASSVAVAIVCEEELYGERFQFSVKFDDIIAVKQALESESKLRQW